MLDVADLHAYYGKSHILQGVDMHIGNGEVVSLLGRNGVGRSTAVKAIMGEVPPQGSIRFKGRDIAGLPSYRIARLGLGYVPEHRDIFPSLTVRQNSSSTRRSSKARWTCPSTWLAGCTTFTRLVPTMNTDGETDVAIARVIRRV